MDVVCRLRCWLRLSRSVSQWATRYGAWVALAALIAVASSSEAASYRTQNFLVDAASPTLARSVGDAAEQYRRELADHWLGRELRPWPTPCPIRVITGPTLAAQGVTEYNRQPVRDFRMEVVGTPRRILDSVLPHEITHTILATHFGRPLPRWADEGICTTVEHQEEKVKHEIKLREFLASRRGIAMNRLFLLTEYPADVLPMYAQGYSVCRFLIEQKGPREFINFLTDYMHHPSWTANIRKHYGYQSLAGLQTRWLDWVADGSTDVTEFVAVTPPVNALAGASSPTPTSAPEAGTVQLVAAEQTAMGAIGRMTPPSVRGSGGYAGLPPGDLNDDRGDAGKIAAAGSAYQVATPQAEGGVGRFRVANE